MFIHGDSVYPLCGLQIAIAFIPIHETMGLLLIPHGSLRCTILIECESLDIPRLDNSLMVLRVNSIHDRNCPRINSPSGIASSPTVLNDGDARALHSTQSHTQGG